MGDVSVHLGLGLGLALGFVHAFDADHILAVSTLASRRPGWRASLGFCLRWGAGHGLTLLALGALSFALGRALPETLQRLAEAGVGVVLIALGLWVLLDLWRQRLHLHFHEHDGLGRHAHWHSHLRSAHHRHRHTATLVGALHGLAGSAPILALLPLSKSLSLWAGLAYLTSFGLGVIAGMLCFGGLLALGFERLRRSAPAGLGAARAALSLGAIALGGYWLL